MPFKRKTGLLMGRRLEGNAARYAQFDLSSKCDLAPKPELSSDPICPFSHSVQTPMPLSASFQLLGTHPAAIVADCNPKLGWTILDFCFDFFRLRVLAGVHNRFTADAVNL